MPRWRRSIRARPTPVGSDSIESIVSKSLTALVAIFVALPNLAGGAAPRVRPALVRIGVILTTESSAADLTLETGTIIDAVVVSGGGPSGVPMERRHLSFAHAAGSPAETYVRLLVSGIRADSPMRWRLTLSPGYDDSRLDRTTTYVVDRANGSLYEAEWRAAVAAQPDWVLVTSWNEFWENTHIEPSRLHGRRYANRTRSWSGVFRR
jgi:hypothetical protein